MVWIIFKIILAAILTESITQVITKSLLFLPVREWFFNRRVNKVFNFLHDLLDCGYCTSVWIGMSSSLLLLNDIKLVFWAIDWFLWGMIVHRLSNVFHFIVDRLGITET